MRRLSSQAAVTATLCASLVRSSAWVRAARPTLTPGKTLAFTRVELRHPVTGKILGTCTRRPNAAYGSHTKFIRMAHGSPANIVFNETGEKVLEGSVPEP